MIRHLFVGDVVGKPGRRVLDQVLPRLIDEHRVDYVVVNVENAAGGFGLTVDTFAKLARLPIDCFTTGNHIWDKKDGVGLLDEVPNLLRPHNYPGVNPGKGIHRGETAAGVPVVTLNLEGQAFMKPLESPFVVADRLLESLPDDEKVIFVDFHAEATSEKQAMGFHLDGRVSAVYGTHTHVPTADDRILPGGTAFLTDVGMTGPYEGIIGFRAEKSLARFLHQTPSPLDVASGDVRLAGVMTDIDDTTGRALSLRRLLIEEER